MTQLDRLHIEVTNVCNFKCEFCPDAIMSRRRGHMKFEVLEGLLKAIAEDNLARIITFHLMGEPFIYPHIFAGIQGAVERSLKLHLTTNGSTFHLFPKHIEQLVQSRVPKVTISLQTPDPHTFQLRGAPPRLQSEAYFDGIVQYVQANLRSPDSPTRIHVKFLDTTPNPFLVPHKPMSVVAGKANMMAELTAWAKRFLEGIVEDDIHWPSIHRTIRRFRPGQWQLIPLHPKLTLETFPLDSWGNVESDTVVPARWGYCNGASQQAGVLYDGTVVPCCKDFEGQIPLGNVTEKPLKAILAGSPACQLRQDFNRLRIKNPICQRCMGADQPVKARVREVASVAYFKAYNPVMRRLYPGWGEV
ncbi:MAG: radical SAM/SPASM domain-containing protein [Cyanobacteria bacterium P01_D01_bin.71]